ncbi:MAG: aldehyde dehydrogenase family protein [Acidimicrobiia bacterium]
MPDGIETLRELTPGMPVIFAGDRVTHVSQELADAFRPGDRVIVAQDTGDLLHLPSEVGLIASNAVKAAADAFQEMGRITDSQISDFYNSFADRLADETVFAAVAKANASDVEGAKSRGRSTTRLVLDDRMREDMIEGLRGWAVAESGRGQVTERVEHDGWSVELIRSGLGVIGFVFEGRPNVFADATGVLRSGNTVAFRIGSDALGTAVAIMENALSPSLADSGLPKGAASLVGSPSRAAGWAMFSDQRLALAVARGSGTAVSQLGGVARQAGTPVSLHGTGGAWIVAADSADSDWFGKAVLHSLDRKVCNTLNTCCILASRAEELVPVFLTSLEAAGERRGAAAKLHATERAMQFIPDAWRSPAEIVRGDGAQTEPRTENIADHDLGVEWEWEESPEVTLEIVDSIDDAVSLFNTQSPRFAASLISSDPDEHAMFYDTIDSPFVSNGFTRWVDGQYALDRPELGLSNWQYGRLFGRGGVLSGDSAFTIRIRAHQTDPDLRR